MTASPSEPTVTLYRPVGPKELQRIAESDYRGFPPRLAGQPFFYPVLNEEYAVQIAREWNAKNPDIGAGYVTRFQVSARYLEKFTPQKVGGMIHQEYWIPAEELAEFNRNIIGPIEVIASFGKQAGLVQ